MIELTVNGEPRHMPAGSTLADLIASLALDPRQVAVERNREIVSRAAYSGTELVLGDQVEIVTFVGGG